MMSPALSSDVIALLLPGSDANLPFSESLISSRSVLFSVHYDVIDDVHTLEAATTPSHLLCFTFQPSDNAEATLISLHTQW